MQTFDIKLNTDVDGIVDVPEMNTTISLTKKFVSTGESVTLNAGNNGWPKYNLLTTLLPEQDLNGYDAPWPPGGRNNTNLIPYPYVDTTTTFGGLTFTALSDGRISISEGICGAKGVAFSFGNTTTNIITLEAGTYTLKGTGNQDIQMFLHETNNYALSQLASSSDNTFTISEQHSYYMELFIGLSANIPAGGVVLYPQLESGDVLTPWSNICPISGYDSVTFSKLYNGTTSTIPVLFQTPPGTVYGGVVDMKARTLTVTHAYYTIDGDEQTWSANSNNAWFTPSPSMKKGYKLSYEDGAMCDSLRVIKPGDSNLTSPYMQFGYSSSASGGGDKRIYIFGAYKLSSTIVHDTPANYISTLKAWLSENPISVTYPLETPAVYYNLDVTTLSDLSQGLNTFSVDNGDLTVCWYESQEFGAPPVITMQPQDQTASVGETVTFTVVATGAEEYQWQYYKLSTSRWVNASGTDATFSFGATSDFNGRQYRCVASNANGSAVSDTVTLTVTDAS